MSNDASLPGAEHLQPHECWAALRGVSLGRLAVWADDHPDIFPVNFTVDHGTLVFRTGPGTKLAAALGEVPVAMEADGVNPDTGVAWSVVVKGKAGAIERIEDVLDTVALLLFPWEAGEKDHFIRITADSITGRRFTVAPPRTWWTPLDDAPRASAE
ncbi:pyridoxamine 5'-phosphate oxidase family protein [Arthrobacter sp. CJ23]|uniref:pyridoxamine 5'-phosphate oxidase family protein n=1 Tax=Arthrobacter sp. CJ23 TaxID=2972479 RepID=UPI00215BA468|nr:pyridoxamine 5'-phosphate oxidase family protein [Arthrobacter sp. CJ23]UVJ40089.1 pyridoxamine 5'-phosphate oxidase family protein [Arthrobacter sp. CJ23]